MLRNRRREPKYRSRRVFEILTVDKSQESKAIPAGVWFQYRFFRPLGSKPQSRLTLSLKCS